MRFGLLLTPLLALLLVGDVATARDKVQAHVGGLPVLRHSQRGWHTPRAKPKAPRKGWLTGGGVVLEGKSRRILLVRNKKEKRERKTNGWTFPKGKDEGEGPSRTARQEVLEEGGVHATPLMHLGVYKEKSRGKRQKIRRHYFLMKLKRDTGRFDHETAEVRWVSLKEAAKMLQLPRDRSVLEQAKRGLDELGWATERNR